MEKLFKVSFRNKNGVKIITARKAGYVIKDKRQTILYHEIEDGQETNKIRLVDATLILSEKEVKKS